MPARRDIQAVVELALKVAPSFGARGEAMRDQILRAFSRSLEYRQQAGAKLVSGEPGPITWPLFTKALGEEARARRLAEEILKAYDDRQRRLRQ